MSAASRQERAFVVYFDLGPSRNLRLLREALHADAAWARPPSLRTLEAWSARYGWQAQVIQIERRAREEFEQQQIEQVQQYRERLRQTGLLLQQKGIESVQEMLAKEFSASQAMRAIHAGFKLEALALEVTGWIASMKMARV